MRTHALKPALLVGALLGCSVESPEPRAAEPAPGTATAAAPARNADSSAATASPAQAAAADSNAEPHAERAAASDSARLVRGGQRLFQTKGCGRCHTIGDGYRDGPDLQGVTERRSFARITALLTDPAEAIQTDPDFQQLRIEHFLDMPNLDLSAADARALYYYLRAASHRTPE